MTEPAPVRRRWFPRSFSIRAILVLMLLVALPLALAVNHISAQRRAVDEILAMARARLPPGSGDATLSEAAEIIPDYESEPSWIHRQLGEQVVVNVHSAELTENRNPAKGVLTSPVTDAEAGRIGLLGVKDVKIRSSQLTDAGVRSLAGATMITDLVLAGPVTEHDPVPCQVTDRGIKLLEKMPGLKSLEFHGPASLASFGNLPELETLNLRLPELGPEGIEPLLPLSKLSVVSLKFERGESPALQHLGDLRTRWPGLTVFSCSVGKFSLMWRPSQNLLFVRDRAGLACLAHVPAVELLDAGMAHLSDADRKQISRLGPTHLSLILDEPVEKAPELLGDFPTWAKESVSRLEYLECFVPGASLSWNVAWSEAELRQTGDAPLNVPKIPGVKGLTLEIDDLSDENFERIAAMDELSALTLELRGEHSPERLNQLGKKLEDRLSRALIITKTRDGAFYRRRQAADSKIGP